MVLRGLNISERRSTRGSGTSTTAVCTSMRPALAVVGVWPRVSALKIVVLPACDNPMMPSFILTCSGACYTFSSGPKWRNWQTRTTQNRVPSGLWVRFPPSALYNSKHAVAAGTRPPGSERESAKGSLALPLSARCACRHKRNHSEEVGHGVKSRQRTGGHHGRRTRHAPEPTDHGAVQARRADRG